MFKLKPSKRFLAKLLITTCIVFALVGIEKIKYHTATPPKNMKTIDDFRKWRGDKTRSLGIYEQDGKSYTVISGPAGGYLPSGPAAYLFNCNGDFVDWTSDMGDYATEKHHFKLYNNPLKKIAETQPEIEND